MVALYSFQNVPHLMCPVVTDMKRAAGILEWAVEKMEERYALLHKVEVRNIYAYNKLGEEEVRALGEGTRGECAVAQHQLAQEGGAAGDGAGIGAPGGGQRVLGQVVEEPRHGVAVGGGR